MVTYFLILLDDLLSLWNARPRGGMMWCRHVIAGQFIASHEGRRVFCTLAGVNWSFHSIWAPPISMTFFIKDLYFF